MSIVRGVRRSAPALLALLAMLLAACGQTETPLQIGIQRAAVDLAFQDEEIEVPEPEVRRVVQQIAGPQVAQQIVRVSDDAPRQEIPPPPVTVFCPDADPNAVITDGVVTTIAKEPPKEGFYRYFQQGSVRLELAGFGGDVPVAPIAHTEVRNVQENVPAYRQQGWVTGTEHQEVPEWDMVSHMRLLTGTSLAEVVDTWRIYHGPDGPGGVSLHKRVRTSGTEENRRTITYEPGAGAVSGWGGDTNRSGTDRYIGVTWIHRHASPGDDWRTEAVDMDHRMMLDMFAWITKREPVNMCGDIVDAYHTMTTEDWASIPEDGIGEPDYLMQTHDRAREGSTGSKTGHPNRFDDNEKLFNFRAFATHRGPMPVFEAHNYRETIFVQVGDAMVPVTFDWNFTRTLMSFEPFETDEWSVRDFQVQP